MAVQYDLILTQNTAPTGVEFSEKYVNLAKGSILTSATLGVPTALPAGADTYHLVANSATATGLEWVAVTVGHTQNTDASTTATSFKLGSAVNKIDLVAESTTKLGVKVDGDLTYADFQAKDATFAQATGTTAPTTGNHLTNKTYVDSILATNDAMIFKGSIGTAGTLTGAAFTALTTWYAGWTYKIITAATYVTKDGSNIVCEIGDLIIATVDRAGAGWTAGDWIAIQTNIDGAVTGPTSTTDNYVALFSGTTGKLLKAGTGALGSAAYVATTTFATSAQGTTADGAIQKSTFTATGNELILGSAASTYSALAIPISTIVGRKATGNVVALSVTDVQTQLGLASAAYTLSTAYATSTQGTTADNAVAKSVYTANTVLYATSSATPLALTVAASTLVGRKATGDIVAMTAVDALNLMWQTAPAAKTSTGTLGSIAKDGNFFYVCTATDTWKRSPLSTNW